MIKNYKQHVKESLLDKLKGPTEEDIWNLIKNCDPDSMLVKSCEIGYLQGVKKSLEIGADMVKLHCEGSLQDLEWTVKAAGKCHVVLAGGMHENSKEFLKQVKEYMSTGITGFAIGRNIWQAKDPLETTKKIKNIIWSEKKR